MKSFTQKSLELTITLGTGSFGEQQGDTVVLSGLRMFADLSSPCGESMGAAHIRVYGMSQSMMNQLTSIGPIAQWKAGNQVRLAAGDEFGMSTAFSGVIFTAWADYSAAPEVPFNIIAYAGFEASLKMSATSYTGATSVADIMKSLAQSVSLDFVNHGVTTQLSSPYFSGDILSQIRACAAASRINYKIEMGALIIWPQGTPVPSPIPVISADTGMIGYPALSSQGMTVKAQYLPTVVLGGQVEVQSSLKMASGKFNVFNYVHNLSCLVPNGPWMTSVDCYPLEVK